MGAKRQCLFSIQMILNNFQNHKLAFLICKSNKKLFLGQALDDRQAQSRDWGSEQRGMQESGPFSLVVLPGNANDDNYLHHLNGIH
jgi:hypothetical protein